MRYTGVQHEWLSQLVLEGGPIETASAVLYFVAAGAAVLAGVRRRRAGWVPAAILCAGGFRELDLHYRLTSGYIFSAGYFLAGTAPISEFLIVVMVLATLSGMTARFIRANWRGFAQDFELKRPWAISLASGLALMVFTVFLDRVQSYLRRNHPAVTEPAVGMWVIEETLELFIPLLFLLAIYGHSAETRQIPNSQARGRAA